MTGRIQLLTLAAIAALAGCDPDVPPSSGRAAPRGTRRRSSIRTSWWLWPAGQRRPTFWRRAPPGAVTQVERRDALAGLDLVMLTFRLPPGSHAPAAIRELEAIAPGVTVGLNHAYRPEPDAGGAGGRTYAGALLAWPDAGCPAYLPVGVLDTGIEFGRGQLAGSPHRHPQLRRWRPGGRCPRRRRRGAPRRSRPASRRAALLRRGCRERAGCRSGGRRRRHHARDRLAARLRGPAGQREPRRPLQQDPRPRPCRRRGPRHGHRRRRRQRRPGRSAAIPSRIRLRDCGHRRRRRSRRLRPGAARQLRRLRGTRRRCLRPARRQRPIHDRNLDRGALRDRPDRLQPR